MQQENIMASATISHNYKRYKLADYFLLQDKTGSSTIRKAKTETVKNTNRNAEIHRYSCHLHCRLFDLHWAHLSG